MYRLLLLTLYLALSACWMVGPDYQEPKTPVTSHWIKQNHNIQEKKAQTLRWWRIFHDKHLTQLIEQGYQQNFSLQKTAVHVLQARAQLAQTVGELYPQQQLMNGNYQYYRIGGNYLQDVLPPTFSSSALGFLANWEIDFWGKYRRAILSNDASFLSSLAAYDQALVSLTADIANRYIDIRSSEALIRVTQDNIRLQKESLLLTESRYRAGEVSLLDVEEAKTMLAQTESELPVYQNQRQQHQDALAVLLGLTPVDIQPKMLGHHGLPKVPQRIMVGIPHEAMIRRPDVQQARLHAIAQSEAIGAVKAQLFPAFSLSGNFSFSANTINQSSLSEMFNWANRNIVAGPTFNWPLLNYGQITNLVRMQDARFQEALLTYTEVVLNAQKEIQDNISAYLEAQKTLYSLSKAARSALKATKLTLIQYQEGETDYTTVLYAEQQQLKVQTHLVQAQTELPKAVIALYRSLGGGWEIRKGHDIVPLAIKQTMAARTYWGSLLRPDMHEEPQTPQKTFETLYQPNG